VTWVVNNITVTVLDNSSIFLSCGTEVKLPPQIPKIQGWWWHYISWGLVLMQVGQVLYFDMLDFNIFSDLQ
jgi:hypothetical protein